MKLRNIKLANKTVEFKMGIVTFDSEGIANVEPDEFAKHLADVNPNYRIVKVSNEGEGSLSAPVGDDKQGDKTLETIETDESDLEEVIETGVSEADETMTHDELDAIASSLVKESRLSEASYKKAKTKKDKVAIINSVE